MKDKTKKHLLNSPTVNEAVNGEPIDAVDLINKYGTYEVQDTTDTDNVFPLIGPLGAGTTGVVLPDIPDAVEENTPPRNSAERTRKSKE